MARLGPTYAEEAMMNRIVMALLAAICVFAPGSRARSHQQPAVPDTIAHRKADLISDGVRLTASLYSLREHAGKRLPTIVLAHGWGGVAAQLQPQAVDFARAGYLAITFDYRGWGESDGRVILAGRPPARRGGEGFTTEVREVREIVDPLEQTADLFNLLHWAAGEPTVDTERIGLWGTSYSGGHVVHVAARDRRVKCLVAQVPALDSRWVGATPGELRATRAEATRRARGELGYPPPGARTVGNLRGAPIREKLLRYAPVEDVAGIEGCAMLFITAEKEELFRNAAHAGRAFRLAREPNKLVEIPGIAHYGIYTEAREQATRLAVEWYDRHLKVGPG